MFDGAPLPPFYEPEYRDDLEILRFDSSKPNPKYKHWIREICSSLATIPLVLPSRAATLCGLDNMPANSVAQIPIPAYTN
jgi:hypothetical protein